MREELRSFIHRRGDETLAAALTAFLLLEVVVHGGSDRDLLLGAAAGVVIGAAAARRSRAPLLFLSFVLAISVAAWAMPTFVPDAQPLALFVMVLLANYSAAAHTSGRRTLVAGAMVVGLYVTYLAMDLAGITAEGVIFYALLLGAPWVAGRAVRHRRLNDRELEHERARAAAAIVDERARIARELHDVVAHAISVMVLQARGGRRVLDAEPADAREAFVTIERTGQQALDEMRRLLGMLRRSDEAPALAPQPGLKELGSLVEQVQAAGLPVQVSVEGEPRELPPGVDLSAFRIVQEALTNTLRHAGPARARVVLRYGADDLELEIADDGPGSGDGSGSGYGLAGMRERVSVYGGEFDAGPRQEGGYALRVRLPIHSARP